MKWTCKGHTYGHPGRQMHSFCTHILGLMFAAIVAKLHPIIFISFVCVFLYVPPIFRKHLFLEHFCTMASISSIEKDSIAVTLDVFQYCILTCKISNQVHTNFEKRKVP